MPHFQRLTRRTALTTIAGSALTALAGCLNTHADQPPADTTPTSSTSTLTTTLDDGQLVVTLAEGLDADQVNLIQPDGELYGKRDVATGVSQVTFALDTSYQPGDYTILALHGDTTTAKTTREIRPDLQIVDVGLYRNHPDKPWDDIYGESETNRQRNGEAFVTVENSGFGPDSAVELSFTGDVPNPMEDPREDGLSRKSPTRIPGGETVDLYSSSFPFGSKSEDGMGCSQAGNSGEFTVEVRTSVGAGQVSRSFNVSYDGSDRMTDCTVEISEI